MIFKPGSVDRYKTTVFMGIILALAVSFLPAQAILCPFVILCIGLFIGRAFIGLLPETDSDFLMALFLSAFLSRIVMALFFYNTVFLYNGVGMLGDAWPFSESGYEVLKMWLAGIRDIKVITENMMKITISGNLGTYDFWNSVVYFFTGKSPLSVIFINCLAGSLTVIFVYYITKQICDIKSARISAVLTAFWPSTFMWSVQNLKEPITIFLVSGLIWAIVALKSRFRFHLVFLLFVLSIGLKEMRMVSFFVLYILAFPVSLFLSIWKSRRPEPLFLFILACFIGLLLFQVLRPYIVRFIPFFPARGNIAFLKWAHAMRAHRATGATAFLANRDFSSPLSLVSFLPLALFIACLAPFPWQVGSINQIMAVPEMLIYYMAIPLMFSGCKFIMKHKVNEGGILIVYVFIMMVVLAFIEGNIGTLFRHRAMVMPFLLILISIGLSQRRVHKAARAPA